MKRRIAILLVVCLVLSFVGCGKSDAQNLEDSISQTAQWLLAQCPEPQMGSIGGEWLLLGLARSGVPLPEGYFDGYYAQLCSYLDEADGILDARKYTEYSRVILALTAMGKNPADVGGYDLLRPLADFEQTVFQGINGPVFALLALDSGNYAIPAALPDQVQATRELYVEEILRQELPGGGWSFGGGDAEIDLTAMVLQALAKYQDDPAVQKAIGQGVNCLSQLQNDNGGYTAYGLESSESISQVIVALGELHIDLEDSRFVKNGNTLLSRLLEFADNDGGFKHLLDEQADLMASEQAFYALVSAERNQSGKQALYTMTDTP